MESDLETLPAITKNIQHLWNSGTQKYDVIDLNTGKLLTAVEPEYTPCEYSPLMADAICDFIRSGMTLTKVCQQEGMPTVSRFYAWLAMNPELRKRYEQARLQRADAFHDKAIDIALSFPAKDDVPGCKLAVDTLKWSAEKNDPDRFGTRKLDIAISQPSVIILNTGIDREGAQTIDQLLQKQPTDIEGECHAVEEGEGTGSDVSEHS